MLDEETLKIVLNNKTFSKKEAESIVGGETRFAMLCEKGKIRYTVKNGVSHSRWACNAWDVIKNARITRVSHKRLWGTKEGNRPAGRERPTEC